MSATEDNNRLYNELSSAQESARLRRSESSSNGSVADALLEGPARVLNSNVLHGRRSGSIREHSPIGDGICLVPPQVPQLFDVEPNRPRPQPLVRKVTVMGSYVLRYESRNGSANQRRQMRQRLRLARLGHHMTFANDESASWLIQDDSPSQRRQMRQRLRLARLDHHMTFANDESAYWLIQDDILAERQLHFEFPPCSVDLEESSVCGLFNWRVYLGMLCIIAAQALLKLAFHEMCNMS